MLIVQTTENKVDVVDHQSGVESPCLMHQHLTTMSDISISSCNANSTVKPVSLHVHLNVKSGWKLDAALHYGESLCSCTVHM